MSLRLVDVYRPDHNTALELPDDSYEVLGHWTFAIDGDQRIDRVLLEVEETEAFLDWLDEVQYEDYRVVLQSVEATLPPPEMEEEEEEQEEESKEDEKSAFARIGRAELYEYSRDATDVSLSFYALVALSTIVAVGGMIRNQPAVVIGAMMIAPLIGPNLALALATALGDVPLLSRALRANVLGGGLALVGAMVIGWAIPVDPTTQEIVLRTVIGVADVALAGAAGAAGVLAITRDQATGLVGVMVAVALLPPVVALGLLLGGGYYPAAIDAGLLTVTNIVALNLAAVCTFLVLGVRPRHWRDLEQARTSVRIALVLWGSALLILLAIFWLTG